MAPKLLNLYKKFGALFILGMIFLIFALLRPITFLSSSNLMNILRQVAIYGIVATGVTFVMVSGSVDLSVGGQVACNGLILAYMMTQWRLPTMVAIIICLVIGTLMGAVNGFLSAWLKISPMIITLCSMQIMNGIATIITGGTPIYDMPLNFIWLGQGNIKGFFPISVIILAVVLVVGWFILQKTYFGRSVYALGGNEEAARLAGIDVFKIRIAVFSLCGFFTTIGMMVLLARTNTASPTAGATYHFDCMTAACLGGITLGGGNGKLMNTFIGVLIIGILSNGLVLCGINTNVQTIVKGMLLLMAVGLDAIQKRYSTLQPA